MRKAGRTKQKLRLVNGDFDKVSRHFQAGMNDEQLLFDRGSRIASGL